jgi:hypothetical protein
MAVARKLRPGSASMRSSLVGDRQRMPVHAAVMLQARQDGQVGGQFLEHRGRAVQLDLRTFAQAAQAGHVIDLRVQQHHGPDGTVAQPAARVQRRAAADLVAEIGRSAQLSPSADTAIEFLRARRRLRAAAALAAGQLAFAVPLRVAADRA